MRILAVALVLCAASLPARAQRSTPAAAPAGKPGTVEIESATQGAEIDIDGEKAGVVPLPQPLTLPPGEHTIKVTRPGYTPYIDVFKVDRKKPTKLSIELIAVAGVLKLTANVENARVYVDGKFVGEAPLTAEVPVGARAIKVQKGGYKDFEQDVSAVAGQETNLDVMLEELPVGINPYKPPPPPPPKWYEKWWVWTVGAVAVGAVVTAVVVPAYYLTRDPVADFCKGNACAGGVVTISLMPVPKFLR
jgi:hypothetical protein